MGKPETYKTQPACATCTFVFIKYDYDEGESYFCTAMCENRPKCGSTSMREEFEYPSANAPKQEWLHVKDVEDWRAWAEQCEVKAWDICNRYLAKQEAP